MNNDHGYINPISLSIAPANVVVGKRYSDLIGSIDLMKRMQVKGVTDGFEFQCLEEWDENRPTLDEREKRLDIWRNSRKYSTHDIISLLEESEIEILSVHAKRDIGIYLCSDRLDDVEEGIRLIWAALYDEFEKFIEVKDRIVNIHLRGELQNSKWVIKNSPFSFCGALDVIRDLWDYKGVLTMEPNGLVEGDLEELIIAMESLK